MFWINGKIFFGICVVTLAAALLWWKPWVALPTVASSTPSKSGETRVQPEVSLHSKNSSVVLAKSGPPAATVSTVGFGTALKWSKLNIRIPLSSVFSAAAINTDLDERAVALDLAAKCLSLGIVPLDKNAVGLRNDARANFDLIFSEAQKSRVELTKYCDEGGVNEYLAGEQRDKRSAGKLYNQMVLSKLRDRQREEYKQAQIQVLANPEKYAVQFDAWLDKNLHLTLINEQQLSVAQIAIVEDELFGRLTQAAGGESLRTMIRCAERYICPSSVAVSEGERQIALQVALRIEDNIRKQRWDLLPQ